MTDRLAESEAYVCPVCLGSIGPSTDRADVWVCLGCELVAPLWYLRLRGIHECERDEQTTAWERLTSTPIQELDENRRVTREWGRSRNLDDYAEVRADLAAGFEFMPDFLHAGYYMNPAAVREEMTNDERATRLGVPVEWLDDDGYFNLAEYETEILDFMRQRFDKQ